MSSNMSENITGRMDTTTQSALKKIIFLSGMSIPAPKPAMISDTGCVKNSGTAESSQKPEKQ